MQQGISNIETLIREEKRLTSVESHGEAWAEGHLAGIEPEIIAEAALSTALSELVGAGGEQAAVALLERMRERVRAGEFEAACARH